MSTKRTGPIPVNTANVPPLDTPGAYDPDGPANGAYCTVSDVFMAGIGIRWEELQKELNTYATAMGMTDSPLDVPTLIAKYLIPQAEADADSYIGQTYKPTEISMFFDGNGRTEMFVPCIPVIKFNRVIMYSVPGIKIVELDQVGMTETLGDLDSDAYFASANILCHGSTGRLFIPPKAMQVSGFPIWGWNFVGGKQNIECSWIYGFENYEDVPASFTRAVALLCAVRCIEATGMIEYRGLASQDVGPVRRSVGREKNLPYGDLMHRMETQAHTILNKFKVVK